MATSAYVPADSANGGMQIRGQGALKTLRNGFARVGAIVDSVNIDRIEVIRGPSATVYGENRPGGIVNIISKKPKTRPGYRMSAGYGSYDFSRVELEATGPLGAARNTYYLFTASNQERRYEQEFSPLSPQNSFGFRFACHFRKYQHPRRTRAPQAAHGHSPYHFHGE